MEKFEPIGLRSGQFGLVAAITILAVWIPNLLAIPPILHVVEMDIGDQQPRIGSDGLMVEVLGTGEVRANGSPVTLHQLSMLAHKLKSSESGVVLNPDPCAPYDVVIKTIAVLKRSGSSHLELAEPDYSTSFGKALSYPGYGSVPGPQSDECLQLASSDRKADIASQAGPEA